ncbi:MAG: AMP-binding protein [Bacteroidota bacterium]|nr:AMP-binding protein [Bacteroidota bacterium]MDP4196975.1 AMP-binding protein [Bacteroidota bacterium]
MFTQDFNKTAIIYNDKSFSYADFLSEIQSFSSLLNISQGQRVALFAENRPEWIFSFFATWNSGGINVPIDFLSTAEEVNFIFNDCKPACVFTSKNNLPVLQKALETLDYSPKIIVFEDIKTTELSSVQAKLQVNDKDDIGVIIYTSGTTGSPKGVMLSFDNLYSNVECITGLGIIGFDDRVIAILPFHHAFPLQGTILMPLYIGGTVIIPNQISSDEIIKTLQKHKITILLGVPRLYNLFHGGIVSKIEANPIAKILLKISRSTESYVFGKKVFKKVQDTFGGHIKYMISGGARLEPQINKDFKALGFKILEGYGMTETSPLISFNPPEKVKIGSVGKPFSAVKLKIVDGELAISGRNVMKGYYNRPEETKLVLRDGWIYSGDLGYQDDEGYIYITGRSKEIIVLPNGKNLNPEEIEGKILKEHSIIKEIGVFQKDGQLFAIIYPDFQQLQKEGIVNIQETIKWTVIDKYNLSAAPYKKIFNFTIVHSDLPKTRLGKLKRYTLSQLIQKQVKEKISVDIPEDQEYKFLEEYLQTIVKKDILPDEHVELDLGLDSLDKVELQVQIEKTFGISMSNEDLSSHSTVRKLAAYIKEKKTKIETGVMHWGKVLKEEIDFQIPKSNYMLKFLKLLTKPFFKFYIRLEDEGLENIPQEPVIIAPNHQSFMDGLLIANVLKNKTLNRTYFFAKDKNIKSWIAKFFARNSNVLILNINKDLKLTLQKIATILKKGNNMVIFPEGARSRDGQIMNFKKSFAIISKELNVPVVPVVIDGAFDKFSIGSKFPKPGKIKLKFLKPIYPGDMDYDSIATLAKEKIISQFMPIEGINP